MRACGPSAGRLMATLRSLSSMTDQLTGAVRRLAGGLPEIHVSKSLRSRIKVSRWRVGMG